MKQRKKVIKENHMMNWGNSYYNEKKKFNERLNIPNITWKDVV